MAKKIQVVSNGKIEHFSDAEKTLLETLEEKVDKIHQELQEIKELLTKEN